MCHEVVLLLKGQAHVGDKKLPLNSASCEPSAFSWSPWGVALGHCALVISDVPVYCLLNALDRAEHSFISVFPSLLLETGAGECRWGATLLLVLIPPYSLGCLVIMGACQNSAPSWALASCWPACDCGCCDTTAPARFTKLGLRLLALGPCFLRATYLILPLWEPT